MYIKFLSQSRTLKKSFFIFTLLSFLFSAKKIFSFPPFITPQITYSDYLRESFHIIKEYYVDKDLLDNQILLEEIVEKAQKKDINLTLNQGLNNITISLKSNTLEFPKPISDINLLDSFEFIAASYLDHHQEASKKEAYTFLVESMMDFLDPHSILLSTKNYQELLEGTEGVFGGLGIIVSMEEDHTLMITEVLPKSPAIKAGLKKNDRIIAIDSHPTYPYPLDSLVSKMKGPPESSVNLTILSEGAKKSHVVKVTRNIIMVDSVDAKVITEGDKHFLYLNIKNFSARTDFEITEHINKTKKMNIEVTGIILDLRENPGGLLGQAVSVSDLFLETGAIVHTKGISEETKSAIPENDLCQNCSIAVLIGPESASASEIVASALQDAKRAIIFGSASFGKSTVQALFEVPSPNINEKEAIKLTIARYYRASGSSLQNIGVTPDLMIQNVFSSEENHNLLGAYRYGSEQFLQKSKVKNPFVKKSAASAFSPYNLYHLISENKEKKQDEDFTLDFALKTLIHSKENWQKQVEKKAVYVDKKKLFEENQEIKQAILTESKKTSVFLANKFKLSWSSEYTHKNLNSVQLKVSQENSNLKNLESGTPITLRYKLKNLSKEPIERVSLFIRDPSFNVSIEEKLLGKLSSTEVLSGTLEIKAPQVKEDTEYTFQVGLAIDGIAQTETLSEHLVFIKKVQEADIKTIVSLGPENGGKIIGTLESREVASLSIELENKSNYPTKEMTLKATNLSGKQVFLDEKEINIPALNANEKREVKIDLKGSEKILEKDLLFGVSLSSFSIYGDKREVVHIKALPN
jgi:carboxyl-terminal processing protease